MYEHTLNTEYINASYLQTAIRGHYNSMYVYYLKTSEFTHTTFYKQLDKSNERVLNI
jgi:hypothetical protein